MNSWLSGIMNSRLSVTIAVAAALLIGAIGYLVGVRSGGPSDTEINTAIDNSLTAPAASLADDATPGPGANGALNESQVAAVRQLIRDHLISNPEIIREAIDALQRNDEAADRVAQTQIISADRERIFASSRQVVIGNPAGDVTLVEFFDYNCGYCKRALADMQRLIEEDGNLRIVLKEFPVLGDGSVEAARVAIAVNIVAPDKYTEFHIALLSEPGHANGDRALAIAEEIGLDVAKIRETLPLPEVESTIAEVYELADSLSLTGTPSYVTAKEVVVGAVGYDTLKARIEEARACGPDGC